MSGSERSGAGKQCSAAEPDEPISEAGRQRRIVLLKGFIDRWESAPDDELRTSILASANRRLAECEQSDAWGTGSSDPERSEPADG